jgi:hypothetical protein
MKITRLSAAALLLLAGLALAAPLAALPPQCDVACKCTSRCTQLCAVGNTVTNCGAESICIGQCFAATTKATETDALRDAIFAASPAPDQPVTTAPTK